MRLIQKRGCAGQQIDRGGHVTSRKGAMAGASEELARACPQTTHVPVDRTELFVVAEGLFEVVTDDLLDLDRAVRCGRLEPVGEALVQQGARLLWDRYVRRIADEHVAEPEGIIRSRRRA